MTDKTGPFVAKFGLPRNEEPKTYDEAWVLLQRLGRGLFGV